MNKLKVAAWIVGVFVGAAVLVVSCKKDKCKEVFCLNGGACVDGKCTCPAWYDRDDCSVAMRGKFLSTFATVISDACNNGGCYDFNIIPGDSANKFTLDGFLNESVAAKLVDSTHFTIPVQNFNDDSITVFGSGGYQNVDTSDVNIVLHYAVIRNWLSADTSTCTAFIHN